MIVRRTPYIHIDVKHPEHPLWMVGVTACNVGELPKVLGVLNDMIASWPIEPITVEQVLAA